MFHCLLFPNKQKLYSIILLNTEIISFLPTAAATKFTKNMFATYFYILDGIA
jgi:hypothetical protein